MSDTKARTILEAIVAVLGAATHSLSAKEIHDRIVKRGLFEFSARDPVGMVRATIRKHVRKAGDATRVKQIERDKYRVAQAKEG